jgi:hypothetical protein
VTLRELWEMAVAQGAEDFEIVFPEEDHYCFTELDQVEIDKTERVIRL